MYIRTSVAISRLRELYTFSSAFNVSESGDIRRSRILSTNTHMMMAIAFAAPQLLSIIMANVVPFQIHKRLAVFSECGYLLLIV